MFFFLSKTLGLLARPLDLALVLLALALVLRWRRRAARLQRWSLRLALVVLVVFSLPVVAQLMLWPLEAANRATPPLTRPPVAIVMLTGMTEVRYQGYELTEASDRIVETVRLARLYPRSRVLLLGGTGSLVEPYQESAVLGRLAVDLGVPHERLVLDTTSRNTHENAVEGAKLLARLPARSGEVLLVTSAVHMPRARACFAKSYHGPLRVVAWPVDYQRDAIRPSSFIPRIRGLRRSTRALNEIFGLAMYWVAGYV